MIGIFDLESKVQIGYYSIVCEIDQAHRRANFNVVIGEKSWWGKDVINETRAALLDEFFNNRGIEKATGNPSIKDGSPLDQYLFGLTKDEWFGSTKKSPTSRVEGAHAMSDCEEAKNLLAEAANCNAATIPDDVRIGAFERWDSLVHLRLVLAIEQQIGRQLDPDEAVLIETLADVAALIATAG